MDADATLSVLNTAIEWGAFLRYENDHWHMVDPYRKTGRRLNLYVPVEDDIKKAWGLLHPGKSFPLAVSDDAPIPDPGVLLLQAHSAYTIRIYWYIEEGYYEEGGNAIEDCSALVQTAKLMRSMRMRVRWIIALLSWHIDTNKATYEPNGAGFKRARDEFEKTKTFM